MPSVFSRAWQSTKRFFHMGRIGIGSIFLGRDVDVASVVGNGTKSSVFAPIGFWMQRAFMEAKPMAYRLMRDGKMRDEPKHEFLKLLAKPNPFYSAKQLIGGALWDYMTDGNGYWLKIREQRGNRIWYEDVVSPVKWILWAPSSFIMPVGDEFDFISGYQYTAAGRTVLVAPENVVHFRHGLDPDDPRRGLSPLRSQLNELAADSKASSMMARLLHNMGIPGLMASPKNQDVGWGSQSPEDIKQVLIDKTTGARQGEPIVFHMPTDLQQFGFEPRRLELGGLRSTAEERLCCVPGTKIVTKRGVVNIEDIVVGDEVVTHMGRWRPVERTFCSKPTEPIYEVSARGLDPLRLTGNHRVYAAGFKKNRRVTGHRTSERVHLGTGWVRTDEIEQRRRSKGQRNAYHALTVPKLAEQTATTLETGNYVQQNRQSINVVGNLLVHASPRVVSIPATVALDERLGTLVGFYLAEGSQVGDGRLNFYFHEDEVEYQQQVMSYMSDIFGVPSKVERMEKLHVAKVVVQGSLVAKLFDLGKAQTKRVPDWAWGAPLAFREAMLRAWVAGDGHTYDGYKHVASTVSEDLAWQMRLIATSCGYRATTSCQTRPSQCVIQGRTVNQCERHWIVRWSESKDETRTHYRFEGDQLCFPVGDKKPFEYDGPVYNIQVAEDNSYLTTGGMVHNCAVFGIHAAVIGYGTGMEQTKVGATLAELRKLSYLNGVIPVQDDFAAEIERAFDREYAGGLLFYFNRDEVEALAEDRKVLMDTALAGWQGELLTMYEAREDIGADTEDWMKVFYSEWKPAAPPALPGQDPAQPPAPAPAKRRKALNPARFKHQGSPAELAILERSTPGEKTPEQIRFMERLERSEEKRQKAFAKELETWFDEEMGADLERLALEVIPAAPKARHLNGHGTTVSLLEAKELSTELYTSEIMQRLDTERKKRGLQARGEAFYLAVAQDVFEALNDYPGLAIELSDSIAEAVMRQGGRNLGLVDLTASTRAKLFEGLADAQEIGLGPKETARRIRELVPAGPWGSVETRADVIARTEVMNAQRVSTLTAYRAMDNVTAVMVFDNRTGFDDEICAALDGQIVSVEDAAILADSEHVNGTRSFAPYIP